MGVCRYPPPHVIPVKITRRINTRVSKLRSRQGRKPALKISCNRLHVRGTLHGVERKDQKMTCRIKPSLRIPEAVESPRARSTRSRLQQRACSLACGTIGQESSPSPAIHQRPFAAAIRRAWLAIGRGECRWDHDAGSALIDIARSGKRIVTTLVHYPKADVSRLRHMPQGSIMKVKKVAGTIREVR